MDHTSAYATLNISVINPHDAFLWSSVSGVQDKQLNESASDGSFWRKQIKDDGGNLS